jgi:hypothetical protein
MMLSFGGPQRVTAHVDTVNLGSNPGIDSNAAFEHKYCKKVHVAFH